MMIYQNNNIVCIGTRTYLMYVYTYAYLMFENYYIY